MSKISEKKSKIAQSDVSYSDVEVFQLICHPRFIFKVSIVPGFKLLPQEIKVLRLCACWDSFKIERNEFVNLSEFLW